MMNCFLKLNWYSTFFAKSISFLLMFCSINVLAQIDTKIDTAHIKIGEPIEYKLSVDIKNDSEIILPELKDTLSKHIEILDQKTDTVTENGQKKLVRKLTLTAFDPGDYLIRSQAVVIGKDTLLSHAYEIRVDDVVIDSANLQGFPIKPIMEESYTWLEYLKKYRMTIAFIVLTLIALIAIWLVFKSFKNKKQNKKYIQKTPYQEAIDALKILDDKKYISKRQFKSYYSDLSFVLRKYLGRVFEFSSLELLSDDLVNHFKNTGQFDDKELAKLKEFLFDSDLAKYAKSVPEEHKHEMYRNWVGDLIEKLKPVEKEDENDAKHKN